MRIKKTVDVRFLSYYDLNDKEVEAFNNKFVKDTCLAKEKIFVETNVGENLAVNLNNVIGEISDLNYTDMKATIDFYLDTPFGEIYANSNDIFFICGKYIRYPDNTIKLISFVTYDK